MAGIARQTVLHGQPLPPPVVLLSGGETTVTVKGSGRGENDVKDNFLSGFAVAISASTALAFGVAGASNARSAIYSLYGKQPQAMAATPSPDQPITHKKKKPKH